MPTHLDIDAAAKDATDPGAPPPEAARFVARLRQSLDDRSFVRLTLDQPRGGDATLQRVAARPVRLRGQDQLCFVWRHASKDITRNLPLDEAVAQVGRMLVLEFGHAHLLTQSHDVQLGQSRKGRWSLRVGRIAAPQAIAVSDDHGPDDGPGDEPGDHGPPGDESTGAPWSSQVNLSHDRARQRALDITTPFLTELGVTDAQQRLIPAMARKWRQINKFVELLGHALERSTLRDAASLRVLDFGAGKGYLTFAVHHALRARGVPAQVTGVELREELCLQGNAVVQRLGLAGLDFVAGDVRSFADQPVDVMIALHACDTATDIAMHRGIRAGAAIIMCSPCCHKELRPQMRTPPLLQPLLRHGIHMAEQAEMLTDSLRALRLQGQGYDTQVFEFVSPEHTSKNKMVLAVKRATPLSDAARAELQAQAAALQDFFGIREQCLARLLDDDAKAIGETAAALAAPPLPRP